MADELLSATGVTLAWAAPVLVLSCAADPAPPPRPPPPPPQAPAEPELAKGLNHHQLRKVMQEKADPAVSGCYTVAYSGKEGGTGSLVVDFVVNPDGSVKQATVNDSTLADPTFETCVKKVYEGLLFPKAPGSTEAARPYNFKNSQGDPKDTAAAATP